MSGRLQSVISNYRQQLLHHEAQAQASLNSAHAHTIAKIQPHIDTLTKQIGDAQQSGKPVPLHWLYEQNRLQTTKALILGEINQYGALAKGTTVALKKKGVQLGEQSGIAQLDATMPESTPYSFGVPSDQAIASIVGSTQKGSPLADLFAGFGAEAADRVGKILISAITLGDNPRKIARDVEDALDISRSRALTIARTECLRAYRMSNLLTMRQNNDVVDKWRWTCDKSDRTCAACLAMDGTLHDLDEEMGSHPNCRCTPVPVTKSWSDILGIDIPDTEINIQSGEDWFNEQDEETQRTILGSAGYKVWSENDDVTLKDFVGKSSDPDWGDSIYQRSAKQVSART